MSKPVFRLKKIIHQNFQLQPPLPTHHTHTHTHMHAHTNTQTYTHKHTTSIYLENHVTYQVQMYMLRRGSY